MVYFQIYLPETGMMNSVPPEFFTTVEGPLGQFVPFFQWCSGGVRISLTPHMRLPVMDVTGKFEGWPDFRPRFTRQTRHAQRHGGGQVPRRIAWDFGKVILVNAKSADFRIFEDFNAI